MNIVSVDSEALLAFLSQPSFTVGIKHPDTRK